MNEEFLQYVWANSLFQSIDCISTTGKAIRILSVGQQNRDSGPDFYNAKIQIDGMLFAGTVEIHQRASDWFRHGHDKDPAYTNVILSVVKEADRDVVDCTGRCIDSIELKYHENLWKEFTYMQSILTEPRCYRHLKKVEPFRAEMILTAYAVERLERKCESLKEMLAHTHNDWESCFYRMLVRYWSGNVNSDAFAQLALNLSYKTILRCSDSLFRIEALLFGFSGLLQETQEPDDYTTALQKEYDYQAAKFRLVSMPPSMWKFMCVRPTAFPTVRLALLAALMHRSHFLYSGMLEAKTVQDVEQLLDVQASSYWTTHYKFGIPSAERIKKVGKTIKDVLIINALVPFIFVYGKERGEERYCEKGLRWLEEIKGEKNHIIRAWEKQNFPCHSALHTQAVLEIKREFCDRHRCLECKIGHEIFKQLKK